MDKCIKCGEVPEYTHKRVTKKEPYSEEWRIECKCGAKTKPANSQAAALKNYKQSNKVVKNQPKNKKEDFLNA